MKQRKGVGQVCGAGVLGALLVLGACSEDGATPVNGGGTAGTAGAAPKSGIRTPPFLVFGRPPASNEQTPDEWENEPTRYERALILRSARNARARIAT